MRPAAPAYRVEPPLTEEEITLLEEKLLPVIAFGVAKSGSARNRQALEMFLAPLTILPFDERAAWAYGDLRAVDTMIAAHALSLQAMLITNNTREFAQVPGLHVDHWAPTA